MAVLLRYLPLLVEVSLQQFPVWSRRRCQVSRGDYLCSGRGDAPQLSSEVEPKGLSSIYRQAGPKEVPFNFFLIIIE